MLLDMFQTTALKPSSWPSWPAVATLILASRFPSRPVLVFLAIIATLDEVCPPTATRSPAWLIEKVLGYQACAFVASTKSRIPVELMSVSYTHLTLPTKRIV